MRPCGLLLALLLSGCSAHTGVGAGSGTPAVSPGASASVELRVGPSVGAIIGLGYLIGIAREEAGYAPRSVPPLDPNRRVVEQDCARTIVDSAANLRCR